MSKDKIQHLVACADIAFLGSFVMALTKGNYLQCFLAGWMAAMGTAVGKEYGDKNAQGNHWCWWDLLADVIGATIGAAVGGLFSVKEIRL